jgi:hypothetical protein
MEEVRTHFLSALDPVPVSREPSPVFLVSVCVSLGATGARLVASAACPRDLGVAIVAVVVRFSIC